MDIKENIRTLNDRISKVLAETGRSTDDVTVIAVTKSIGMELIDQAVKAGCLNLGENRVQEMMRKIDQVDRNVKWHMIGRLQTNKVKYIVNKAALIHSLDRFELGAEIEKQASKAGCTVPVLVQVNASGENTKAGVYPEETIDFVKRLSHFDNIRIMGLMTIGPNTAEKDSIRTVFKTVKDLFDELGSLNIKNTEMKYLSMGMSNDFEIALREGSNMIRVGTKIFGSRK